MAKTIVAAQWTFPGIFFLISFYFMGAIQNDGKMQGGGENRQPPNPGRLPKGRRMHGAELEGEEVDEVRCLENCFNYLMERGAEGGGRSANELTMRLTGAPQPAAAARRGGRAAPSGSLPRSVHAWLRFPSLSQNFLFLFLTFPDIFFFLFWHQRYYSF